MMLSIFGRKFHLVWVFYCAFFAVWFFWKGILLFSIIAFTPSVILDYYLKKAGWGLVLRTLSFASAFFLSAATYNQIRPHF